MIIKEKNSCPFQKEPFWLHFFSQCKGLEHKKHPLELRIMNYLKVGLQQNQTTLIFNFYMTMSYIFIEGLS